MLLQLLTHLETMRLRQFELGRHVRAAAFPAAALPVGKSTWLAVPHAPAHS
ncbi:hypothetical protein [Sphingomonas sp.]|uniref:hypothetical protein n=1 Tax=Sphingomonas sp. TaxID=28214 RepID=UPI00286BE040|nr:hypothetical protein [Sphingomonas sp.]